MQTAAVAITTPVIFARSGETVSIFTYEPALKDGEKDLATMLARSMDGGSATETHVPGLYQAIVTDTQYDRAKRERKINPVSEPASGFRQVPQMELELEHLPPRQLIKKMLQNSQGKLPSDKGR